MQDGSWQSWREILDRHHTALVDDLGAQFDRELESKAAAATAAEHERAAQEHERFNSEQRERFNEERQRFNSEQRERFNSEQRERFNKERQLLEAEFTQTLSGERARAAEESRLRLSESLNHTLASCVETRDPVVALAAPAEISSILSLALSSTVATEPGGPPAKAYLFPITVRQTTVAVMLASGDVTPAPIELLCEAVGMKLESLDVAPSVSVIPAPFVNIAPAQPTSEKLKPAQDATTWSKLTPEQQALHLRAQRFARVRTAQIRISESEDLRKGAQQGDIYSALRPSIDAARHEYQRSFMAQSPTMVDYLHLELIRSLARENSRLMGQNYPGPIESIE